MDLLLIFHHRDRNRQKVVDHRLQNLTPNRREEMQQMNRHQYKQETTSDRNLYSEDRIRKYSNANDQQGSLYSNQPLARVSFGLLPYPAGNAS